MFTSMSRRFSLLPVSNALLALLAVVALLGTSAQAQFEGKVHLQPTLLADTATVVAGKPFTVGLLLKMDPGWHTYWEYPGEYGFALTAQWQLPAGFEAGPIQWPLPTLEIDGDDISYVYEKEVMLLVEITPPPQLPAGELDLAADLKWQVCEKTCIPGSGHVDLKLAGGAQTAPANAETFTHWRALLPKPDAPFARKWDLSNPKELRLVLDQAPADPKLEFYPLPPAGTTPGRPKVNAPAAAGHREISVPLEQHKPPQTPWRGVVAAVKADGSREAWVVADDQKGTATPPPPAAGTTLSEPVKDSRGLGGMLVLAFFGGLILNVMPCVLPVIALKIFGFVRQAGHEPQRVFRLGLAFVAGVFTFFLGLALAVIVLHWVGRGFNWGFQFQNGYVLAGLTALVFVFGLNLLGVFEVTLAGGATNTLSELSSKEGYGGAYLHGMFTTLLGTSCTAPLLSPSLGYAVTQSAPVIVLLFLTVAAGMSLPYFLLTAQPAWLKYLPKPGMWMERFKQVMGFVMLAVGVWLFTQFSTRGPEAVTALSWYLLLLGVACWLMGVLTNRAVATAIVVVAALGGYFALLHGRVEAMPSSGAVVSSPEGIQWIPFSEEKLSTAVARGEPVFVDFTASWCWNCHVFEKAVLETQPVRDAFRSHKIVPLRADWSNGDPEISRWLKRFNRVGVPLYVLYRPGEAQPMVFDALTTNIVLSSLATIK